MARERIEAIGFVAFVLAIVSLGQPGLAEQVTIEWVERMPRIPQPFEVRDWWAVARNYDRFVSQLRPLCLQLGG